MVRLIVLTFAFLGLAFYEMSGGADFEPQMARAETLDERPGRFVPARQIASDNSRENASQGMEVTRVSLNLTSVEDVVQGKTRKTQAAPAQVTQAAAAPTQELPQIILPSLVQNADASVIQVSSEEPAATARDFRSVTANRANVRGGPGTNFGIVSKVELGEEVEVLEDNGNGWVRMRSVDGGPVGWIADFLLTEG